MNLGLYKKLSSFALNGINTCVSLIKIVILSRPVKSFPKPDVAKCLVLGTGPSMKISFEKNRNYFLENDLLVVNSFCMSDEYERVKPKHYLILDPNFFISDKLNCVETWKDIDRKTDWEMNLYLPRSSRKYPRVQKMMQNKFVKIYFFNYTVFKGFDSIAHFFYRHNMAMQQSSNVMVPAIFTAINIGYKQIEIFGADHNWHEQLVVDDKNVVCIKHQHFYREDEAETKLIPFYKYPTLKPDTFTMDEIFQDWSKVFYAYRKLNKYAQTRGCKVLNASEVTFIDAFERIKIEGK